MIINADTLVPYLKQKVRPTKSDASRHLLCPRCERRTRLNTLRDGRRKCTVCGKKFHVNKVTEKQKLKQCAEILLCFCLDASVRKAAKITTYPPRMVTEYYEHFRMLLGEQNQHPAGTAEQGWRKKTRARAPDVQARSIINLMPVDFLDRWLSKRKR